MLDSLGLGKIEETVYHALVRRVEATAAEVASDLRTTPALARSALRNLVERGLVLRGTGGRPARYAAVPPDVAIEPLVRRQETALHEVRSHVSDLMRMYNAGTSFVRPDDVIEVVTDLDELNRRWVAMQQATRGEMRGFDRPPYATPTGERALNAVEYELLGRGVRYRVVYDRSVLELPGWVDEATESIRLGEQARIGVDVPMKLAISDKRLAIIPLARSGDSALTASYFVHPSPLLDALVALFEAVWERSVILRNAASPEPDPNDITADELRLLVLFAGGATDRAASRVLGWSERTVQRHVSRIMQRLGAETRFQVAMEAVRRGWL
jgi:DNA-binding CsgD family transcriptional regulator/predicted transcriptional regulator